MIITDNIEKVRAIRWQDNVSWGLVPTMGYLHAGHLALVEQAKADNERIAVSIYVNPTQFAADEDLSTYPRDLEHDLTLLRAAGVDLVFTPSDAVMYPDQFQTSVRVKEVTQVLEGGSRPTHFEGVTTIVTKLLNIVQPTCAYFGQKDAQQTVVVRRLVEDLNINTEIVIVPTMREADGLAMSSRNKYLDDRQRKLAPVLRRSLLAAEQALEAGERDSIVIRALIYRMIAADPLPEIDYISVADPVTLAELDTIDNTALISLAVFFGTTRLIDNLMWESA